MSRLYIYCEGWTEKIFAEDILSPFLSSQGIFIQTILAGDGINGKRGGVASYEQIKRELLRLCHGHRNEFVTTLIDYSPEMAVHFEYDNSGTLFDRVCSKEKAIEDDLGVHNLLMNFELHEFEAYLYCSPEAFKRYSPKAPLSVQKIVKEANGPELINTNPNTLPSRRLDTIIPGYTKAKKFYSKQIMEHLSLEQIRSQCNHFDKWLNRICEICGN